MEIFGTPKDGRKKHVTIAKITPGEYYCPSCGDYFKE